MGLGIDPTNDYVFRLAFGDPANSDLLIHLLNAILELPSPIIFRFTPSSCRSIMRVRQTVRRVRIWKNGHGCFNVPRNSTLTVYALCSRNHLFKK